MSCVEVSSATCEPAIRSTKEEGVSHLGGALQLVDVPRDKANRRNSQTERTSCLL